MATMPPFPPKNHLNLKKVTQMATFCPNWSPRVTETRYLTILKNPLKKQPNCHHFLGYLFPKKVAQMAKFCPNWSPRVTATRYLTIKKSFKKVAQNATIFGAMGYLFHPKNSPGPYKSSPNWSPRVTATRYQTIIVQEYDFKTQQQ